ncbi:hypothetical protein JKP88DRAFT_249115 [Tribonema minus]|uniref:Uncharacterized protein n=1 Tax=Tribonema minus TaxID=303371 RepID=A0A835YKB9_9STRA|nr:hypothetical protein JKP88DRAFT_249115 [Tribonema minus]
MGLSASKGQRELAQRALERFHGLVDALNTKVEILEGCKRGVRELAADAPNRESTIIEAVTRVHHLYDHVSDLYCSIGDNMLDRPRDSTAAAITRERERLDRLGGGPQRVPLTQEEKDEIRKRLGAHFLSIIDCRAFIKEHLPLLVQRNAAPWAGRYPGWQQQHEARQQAQMQAQLEQQRQQQDIANAPDVFAKFRCRPHRMLHRRIDSAAPFAARARVSAPATAAAAEEAAAGPMLPDGDRVAVRDSAQQGGRRRSQAADHLQGSRRRGGR